MCYHLMTLRLVFEITGISKGFYTMKLFLTLSILLTCLTAHSGDQLSSYSLQGGNCSFSGSWTSESLGVTRDIRGYVDRLKGIPACKGIESIFSEIEAQSYSTNVTDTQNKEEAISSELGALREVMAIGGNNSNVLHALLGKTLENVFFTKYDGVKGKATNANYGARTQGTIKYGLNMVNNLLVKLPEYEQCLYNRPGVATSLMGGVAKLLSAFSGSGEGSLSGLGNTIHNYVKFMQDRKFSKVFKELDSAEFIQSLSCLMETVNENYCMVKDAYEMLNFTSGETTQKLEAKIKKDKLDPISGYFIMKREVPIISRWLQKVMFGVKPRVLSDSLNKNEVIDNINELLQAENSLKAAYGQATIDYQGATNQMTKKNMLLTLIKTLRSFMMEGHFKGGAKRGDVNFFDRAKLMNLMPFYLIGREIIPKEVAANLEGKFQMRWDDYMENAGNFIKEFDDPDHLLIVIEDRLDKVLEIALREGSAYLQKRLIVDRPNLIDESFTSQTISVFESFENVRDYLNKLIVKISQDSRSRYVGILWNMISTRDKINKILASYYKLQKITMGHLGDSASQEEFEIQMKKNMNIPDVIEDIVMDVYMEFNVILQRDTFLITRMDTFVRYAYAYLTKNNEDMTEYQNDLMVVAGRDIIDRLMHGAYKNNPAMVRADLDMAQEINRRNLEEMENLFDDALFPMIHELDSVSEDVGYENNPLRDNVRNMNSFKRLYYDGFTNGSKESKIMDKNAIGIFNPFKVVTNFFIHSDRYQFTLFPDLKARFGRDSYYNSAAGVRSRLCMQTLYFNRNSDYYRVCEGSLLLAQTTEDDDEERERLSVEYDELLRNYVQAKVDRKIQRMKELREDNICSLRNFRRKNEVYWLIKSFNKDTVQR